MKNQYRISLALVAFPVLVGCATSSPKPAVGPSSSVLRSDAASKDAATLPATVENPGVKVSYPDWFLSPPQADRVLYASASAVSGEMQIALEKAILNAQHTLASQLGNAVSGRKRAFTLDRGMSDPEKVSSEMEKVVRELVSDVNLGGYKREKTDIYQTSEGYRAFVLLSYRLDGRPVRQRAPVRQGVDTSVQERANRAFSEIDAPAVVQPTQ